MSHNKEPINDDTVPGTEIMCDWEETRHRGANIA
jgi:hypothetical protein